MSSATQSRNLKTLSIPDECHRQLHADAREFTGMKLGGMVQVYQRAWRLLSPEQQMRAIRCADEMGEEMGEGREASAVAPVGD